MLVPFTHQRAGPALLEHHLQSRRFAQGEPQGEKLVQGPHCRAGGQWAGAEAQRTAQALTQQEGSASWGPKVSPRSPRPGYTRNGMSGGWRPARQEQRQGLLRVPRNTCTDRNVAPEAVPRRRNPDILLSSKSGSATVSAWGQLREAAGWGEATVIAKRDQDRKGCQSILREGPLGHLRQPDSKDRPAGLEWPLPLRKLGLVA